MKFITNTVKLLLLTFLIYSSPAAFAQNVITGVVKNSKGLAVPNATVSVRGTNVAVSANENGEFSITPTIEPPFYLQVKSVGFKPQDFQVLTRQSTLLELTLVEDDLLSEIVVTSRRRRELLQD